MVDPHLSVMCLCVKDQFPVNLSTMLTFSEADLPAVNLFICCFMTGSRCAVCVTHALILWPLSLAFLFFCLFVWVFFLCAVFSCFYFIWVMFHSCCSFLRRQWMYKYEIQFLYCLLMFPNLQEACYLCSF